MQRNGTPQSGFSPEAKRKMKGKKLEKGADNKKKKKTQEAQESTRSFQLDGNAHIEAEYHELRVDNPGELHGDLVLSSGTEGKKSKKNKKKRSENDDRVGQDRVRLHDGKNSLHSSEEDDMLLNVNTQPELITIGQSKALRASQGKDKKTEQVLTEDNESSLVRHIEGKHTTVGTDEKFTEVEKRKKRKKDNEDEGLLYVDHTDANGSMQQNKKLQTDTFSENQQLKVSRKIVKPDIMVAQQNSKVSSRPTFSMAVAGSIVDNAQSLELATMLAGQIARAAVIFRVDEIVVFDDYDGAYDTQEEKSEEVGGLFMVRILKYLEVPQYLRRALIPMHQSLSSVGKLPPLDAPHHLRKHEWRPFREGVVLDKRPSEGSGSYVDVGLDKEVRVQQALKPRLRVTVAMGQSKADGDVLQVADREAAQQAGFYWGYTVRYANCLSAVFDECPFEGKYDFCIGTSEHGEKIRPTNLVIPKCKHLLVAFGGLSGLEESLELDKKLKLQRHGMTRVFNRYLNTCPDQGSRTIRTEEAILISLQFLQAAVQDALRAP